MPTGVVNTVPRKVAVPFYGIHSTACVVSGQLNMQNLNQVSVSHFIEFDGFELQ